MGFTAVTGRPVGGRSLRVLTSAARAKMGRLGVGVATCQRQLLSTRLVLADGAIPSISSASILAQAFDFAGLMSMICRGVEGAHRGGRRHAAVYCRFTRQYKGGGEKCAVTRCWTRQKIRR